MGSHDQRFSSHQGWLEPVPKERHETKNPSKPQADEAFYELLFGNCLCAQGSAIIQYDDQAHRVQVVDEQGNDGKIWVVCKDQRSAKGISTTLLRDATKPDG